MTVYAPWANAGRPAPTLRYTPNPTQLRQQWPRNTGSLARALQVGLAPSMTCDSLAPHPQAWYNDPPSVLGSIDDILESPATQIREALAFLMTRHAKTHTPGEARRDFDLLQMQTNAFLASRPSAFFDASGGMKNAPSPKDAPVWAKFLRILDTSSPVSRGILAAYPQLSTLCVMWETPSPSSLWPVALVGAGLLALLSLSKKD